MAIGSERGAVQNPILCYAQEVGWRYLPPDEACRLRRGEAGLLLHDIFVERLCALNPEFVTPAIAEGVAGQLARVRPTIEGNLEAWEYLNGLKTVFVPEERRERNVRLLDPGCPERNAFHVTDELTFQSGSQRIRVDLAFFVNGVPVLLIETKSARRLEGIQEALAQVERYHQQGAPLMAVAQLYALTNLTQFLYAPTWSLGAKDLMNWRDEQAGDFETLVKTFLAPSRILRLLTEFILFVRRDGELSKAVLRPHQMRAVERVVQRARDESKHRALIWHTQGSGKTYTMITVARRLLQDPAFENPTVLMLVDRNELEQQLFANLQAVGFGRVEVAQSKHHLQRLLREDYRGLIVSTIHKFDKMPAKRSMRANIYVLIDEAHRSTGGDLGNYLMGALPNATYIGFTGTPIDRSSYGKGTFKVFGSDDPPHGYLDRYSIRESIADGATVPLHYALAPNDLQVDRDTLEREFLALTELEGVSDIEDINRVLERAVTLRQMLKSPERMRQVAAFVAEHFRTVIEPMGYKAFLVAVDREACCRYKALLDEYLPSEYSRVVISAAANDPLEVRRYHMRPDEEQRVREAFRKPDEPPKILIVTEKLLTGFDAPILYCMYLDKPMRDHVLLQAIARVNRPYEDSTGRRKPAGFVLDFVGIFENLERALAFDSKAIQGVVKDLKVLKGDFERRMAQARQAYLSLCAGLSGDKAVEAVLEHFRDPERRSQFYRDFQALQEVYEILSPDEFLRPFLDDYRTLCEMYQLLRSCYEARSPVASDFLRKTAALVQEHTRATAVREPSASYAIDHHELRRLALNDADAPDVVKVFNLVKAIRQIVAKEASQQPYLIPIGERAEAIVRAFEARQLTTQETLQQLLEDPVQELEEAAQARQRTSLSDEAFTIYWLLQRKRVKQSESVAREIEVSMRKYPHWRNSEQHKRELRREITKQLFQAGVHSPKQIIDQILTLL
jgi:type I restriction enzyme R subunit